MTNSKPQIAHVMATTLTEHDKQATLFLQLHGTVSYLYDEGEFAKCQRLAHILLKKSPLDPYVRARTHMMLAMTRIGHADAVEHAEEAVRLFEGNKLKPLPSFRDPVQQLDNAEALLSDSREAMLGPTFRIIEALAWAKDPASRAMRRKTIAELMKAKDAAGVKVSKQDIEVLAGAGDTSKANVIKLRIEAQVKTNPADRTAASEKVLKDLTKVQLKGVVEKKGGAQSADDVK